MFQEKKPLFLYCISPVHMGAGTALGAVDNPIQREIHTGHPTMAGSGLKGAFRDVFAEASGEWGRKATPETNRIFGPAGEGEQAADHAGAVSFADAQLVLFPVRSLRRSFVYATCPTALGRLQRLLAVAGIEDAAGWKVPEVRDDRCRTPAGSPAVAGGTLVLETYQFDAQEDPGVGEIATWLADNALPDADGFGHFHEKLTSDLVVLSDERFNHFVKHATLVEPHVRINDESGTADDRGLFYTENLPPESLLVTLVMASRERVKKGESDREGMTAREVMGKIHQALDGRLAQVGGDATTGRGQVMLRFAGGA